MHYILQLQLVGLENLSFETTDFCQEADAKARLDEFEQLLNETTNRPTARRQASHTDEFLRAIRADATLYGQSGHECPDVGNSTDDDFVSGKKAAWQETIQDGPFFPGYCAEAQEAAIELARSATCKDTICECAKPFGLECCCAIIESSRC
jgi:hypothetical protein